MDIYNPSLVNIYIEASSKENLVMLQVLTNHTNGKSFNYQTPMKDGKKWVVWFYADVNNYIASTEEDLKKGPKDMSLKDMMENS